jgi:hypothetical protein
VRRQVCILFNRFKRDPITSGKLSVYEMVSTESTRNTVEISILWDYIRFVNELNINPLLYLNLTAMVIIWKVEFN